MRVVKKVENLLGKGLWGLDRGENARLVVEYRVPESSNIIGNNGSSHGIGFDDNNAPAFFFRREHHEPGTLEKIVFFFFANKTGKGDALLTSKIS